MATFSIFTIAKNLPQKSMKDKEKIVNISTSQQSLSSSYTSSSANSVSSTPSNLLPSSTSGLAVAVPGVNLLNSEDLNIPILMYHHISTTDGIPATDATAIGLRVGPKVFEKQMEKLKAKGYNTISSQQIVDYQYKSVPLPKNPILLTFDDGYKDNFINAFPVLKKLGLKGEFAIITNVIGEGEYMSWDDAKIMKEAGMYFSSHTFFHCYLAGVDSAATKINGYKTYLKTPIAAIEKEDDNCPNINFGGALDSSQVRGELKKSKKTLKEKLGVDAVSVVYPFGNYNDDVMRIAKEEGYFYGMTVEGQNNGNLNFKKPYKLQRTRIFGQQELPLTGFFG
jgi:peptidoglycan/xylan/chitin deacetylase (PgdA/CDA1 family)